MASAAGPEEGDVLQAVEAAMIRLRRSMGRRTLGKALLAELQARGEQVDLAVFGVLDAVEEGATSPGGVVTVGDVAARIDLDPSRASRVVAAAVASGHLRRVAAQEDARRVGLELTPTARELLQVAHEHRQRRFAAAMTGWTDHERAEFARLLTKFTAPDENHEGPATAPGSASTSAAAS